MHDVAERAQQHGGEGGGQDGVRVDDGRDGTSTGFHLHTHLPRVECRVHGLNEAGDEGKQRGGEAKRRMKRSQGEDEEEQNRG